MQITESFVPNQRAFTETLMGLNAVTLEAFNRLVELNAQVARDAMAEVGQVSQVMLSTANPQQFIAEYVNLYQSRGQRAVAYGRQVQEIASSAGSEVSEAVRAVAARIQSSFQGAGENSSVAADEDDRTDNSRLAAGQDSSGASQIPDPQGDGESADDAQRNSNGGRAPNGSEKSHHRSGRSGAGRGHGT